MYSKCFFLKEWLAEGVFEGLLDLCRFFSAENKDSSFGFYNISFFVITARKIILNELLLEVFRSLTVFLVCSYLIFKRQEELCLKIETGGYFY